jgi:hypothetical protein
MQCECVCGGGEGGALCSVRRWLDIAQAELGNINIYEVRVYNHQGSMCVGVGGARGCWRWLCWWVGVGDSDRRGVSAYVSNWHTL